MKRLLIYPAITPILAVLSLFVALWQRGLSSPLTMPTWERIGEGGTWGDWSFPGLILGLLLVPLALGLDFLRNRTREVSLAAAARIFATQWVWLTFYAAILIAVHAATLPMLQAVPLAPIQFLLDLSWQLTASHGNFPFLCHGLAFLGAILRATARRVAPSPPLLWHQWKQFQTLHFSKTS